MSDEITISVMQNGPYVIRDGGVKVVDMDGGEYDVSERPVVALCRCGGSTNKPFCDGTHSRVGFEAAERAVEEQG